MGFCKADSTLKQRPVTVRESSLRGFVATVNAPRISDEQAVRAVRQMHSDMKSYRIRREKALEDSTEFAKHYTCKAR